MATMYLYDFSLDEFFCSFVPQDFYAIEDAWPCGH